MKPPKINKKCANRSQRTKIQTPIVGKQTIYKSGIPHTHIYGICILQICKMSMRGDNKG